MSVRVQLHLAPSVFHLKDSLHRLSLLSNCRSNSPLFVNSSATGACANQRARMSGLFETMGFNDICCVRCFTDLRTWTDADGRAVDEEDTGLRRGFYL
ncbi:hypothetical protein CVT24_008541 [Panaeolus cyanescens]|uniref:Uncharacterized protein n=1 Tax=Panaeolus cyanescens TaxID=181874 RepID=A0A409VL01_9AGAR|nr:hypothetical protein CVT24_008541 [Panaeolus cyanescens]